MARFYQREEEYRFESGDGLDEPITQDNFTVWLHREVPLKDMASMQDHRDGLAWSWFRYDVGDEQFNQLDMIARQAGRVILGSLPVSEVEQIFDNKHQMTEDDFNELLGRGGMLSDEDMNRLLDKDYGFEDKDDEPRD